MENWKVEVTRLNVIREKLGLNWNQLEKLTNVPRGKVANMFKLNNEPSLGFYLLMKNTLENQIEVVKDKKKVSAPKKVDASVESTCECRMAGTLFIRGKGCAKAKDEHKF